MRRLANLVSGGFGSLLIITWLVLGVRNFTSSAWISDSQEVAAYEVVGDDDRLLHIQILPGNFAILAYDDPNRGDVEVAVAKWRGSHGKRYPLGWWNFPDAPMPSPNWRRSASDHEPVFMEMTRLEHFGRWSGQSTFPEGTTYGVVEFAQDGQQLAFEGMPLRRVPPEPVFAMAVANQTQIPEVRQALQQLTN